MNLGKALIEPKLMDADAAKHLIRKLIELSVTVGLMPFYAQTYETPAMCGGFLPSGRW